MTGAAVDCLTSALEIMQEHVEFRATPYEGQDGQKYIGYHRPHDGPITQATAFFMLTEDLEQCMTDLFEFHWWLDLKACRQAVLINIRSDLGFTEFRKLIPMLSAIGNLDYELAAKQIAIIEPSFRYRDLSRIMQNGF